jgi:hypothetical protein
MLDRRARIEARLRRTLIVARRFALDDTIRNSHRARGRGWITTSTSVAELSVTANAPARTLTFRWRTSEDNERDSEAAAAERLRGAGKPVASIGWGDPDDGKTIEHEANPEPSNKD